MKASVAAQSSPASPPPGDLDSFAVGLPAFARSFSQGAVRMAWLLGAGASAMSKLPTASDLMRQFRHAIFCSENGLVAQHVDERDPRVQQSIRAWFAARSDLPHPGDADEYAALFELAYDRADDRAALIKQLVAAARPNYGHHVMAALMGTDQLRVVFTTNFDDLPEQAARSLLDSQLIDPRRPLVTADLEGPDVAVRALTHDMWPLVVKLHGDFRSDALKNTTAELQAQDRVLRRALLDTCRRFGLIVAGYSGRDASVMQVLFDALDTPGALRDGLVWCHRPGEQPFPEVVRLLRQARDAGVDVRTVAVDNFIELLAALERTVALPAPIRGWLQSRRPPSLLERVPLPPAGTLPWPVLRTNALPLLAMPTHARALSASSHVTAEQIADRLRATRARGLAAVRRGGQLIAFGDDAELAAALGPLGVMVTNQTVSLDLDDTDLDTVMLGLLRDGAALALGRTAGLRTVLRSRADHLVRVDDPNHPSLRALAGSCGGTLGGVVPGTAVRWAEAVTVTLDSRHGTWWLLAAPEVWIAQRPSGTPPSDLLQAIEWRSAQQRLAAQFVRDRLAGRYNRSTAAILAAWTTLLVGRGDTRTVHAWVLEDVSSINATFTLAATTGWSRPLGGPLRDSADDR
jgi:SIR2-like domain